MKDGWPQITPKWVDIDHSTPVNTPESRLVQKNISQRSKNGYFDRDQYQI